MRIWSIHPRYLDAKGLVALWRETLLARHVLEGRTKGYRNHPQLTRFKQQEQPLAAIDYYLEIVCLEAGQRQYNFDRSKFKPQGKAVPIAVTTGQINYEREHLLSKLKVRDNARYHELVKLTDMSPHPLFTVVKGGIESWEVTGKK